MLAPPCLPCPPFLLRFPTSAFVFSFLSILSATPSLSLPPFAHLVQGGSRLSSPTVQWARKSGSSQNADTAHPVLECFVESTASGPPFAAHCLLFLLVASVCLPLLRVASCGASLSTFAYIPGRLLPVSSNFLLMLRSIFVPVASLCFLLLPIAVARHFAKKLTFGVYAFVIFFEKAIQVHIISSGSHLR